MKKIISILLAATLFVGCSGANESESEVEEPSKYEKAIEEDRKGRRETCIKMHEALDLPPDSCDYDFFPND